MLQIDIRCGKTMKMNKLEWDHLIKKINDPSKWCTDAKISLCLEVCYVFMFDYSMNTASKWCMEDVNVRVVVAIKWNESDVASFIQMTTTWVTLLQPSWILSTVSNVASWDWQLSIIIELMWRDSDMQAYKEYNLK
jgi:hypothetical protein